MRGYSFLKLCQKCAGSISRFRSYATGGKHKLKRIYTIVFRIKIASDPKGKDEDVVFSEIANNLAGALECEFKEKLMLEIAGLTIIGIYLNSIVISKREIDFTVRFVVDGKMVWDKINGHIYSIRSFTSEYCKKFIPKESCKDYSIETAFVGLSVEECPIKRRLRRSCGEKWRQCSYPFRYLLISNMVLICLIVSCSFNAIKVTYFL